jgi:hypothetical protein
VDDASAVGGWGGEPATEESRTLPFIVGMVLCLAGSRLLNTLICQEFGKIFSYSFYLHRLSFYYLILVVCVINKGKDYPDFPPYIDFCAVRGPHHSGPKGGATLTIFTGNARNGPFCTPYCREKSRN